MQQACQDGSWRFTVDEHGQRRTLIPARADEFVDPERQRLVVVIVIPPGPCMDARHAERRGEDSRSEKLIDQ
jgi:hypothetical protein